MYRSYDEQSARLTTSHASRHHVVSVTPRASHDQAAAAASLLGDGRLLVGSCGRGLLLAFGLLLELLEVVHYYVNRGWWWGELRVP